MLFSDETTVAANSEPEHVIFCDVFSPESVIFTDSGSPQRIEEVSSYFQVLWHAAFNSALKGDAALQPLETNVWHGLQTWSQDGGYGIARMRETRRAGVL